MKRYFKGLVSFFSTYVYKHWKIYGIVLSLISAFEIGMIIRGVLVFNFSKDSHFMYLGSYIFLVVCSLLSLLSVILFQKDKINPYLMTVIIHLYSTMVIAWSTLVSYLDLLAGNTPIVYFTVILAVAGLAIMHPVYYIINLIISFTFIFTLQYYKDIAYFNNGGAGLIANIMVLLIIAVVLCYRNYVTAKRDLKVDISLEDNLSYIDQLTSVYNRRKFEVDLKDTLSDKGEYIIGLIDIDDFKNTIDSYDRKFSDDYLIKSAKAVNTVFDNSTYRIGGAKFAVIYSKTTQEQIEEKINIINLLLKDALNNKNIGAYGSFIILSDNDSKEKGIVMSKLEDGLLKVKEDKNNHLLFVK